VNGTMKDVRAVGGILANGSTSIGNNSARVSGNVVLRTV
jgi:hypothetical protein